MKKLIQLCLCCFIALPMLQAMAQEENQSEQSSDNKGLTITADGVTTSGQGEEPDEEVDSEMSSDGNKMFVCTLNDVQRRVEVALLNPPMPVPCEVNYYKDTEAAGAKTTLWSAQNDTYYCTNQAQAFVEKLQTMSWTCSDS